MTTSLGLATRRRIAFGYWECIGKGIAHLNTPPGFEAWNLDSEVQYSCQTAFLEFRYLDGKITSQYGGLVLSWTSVL